MSKIFEALTEASKKKPEDEPRPAGSKAHKQPNESPVHHLPESDLTEYRLLRQRIVRLTPNLDKRVLLFMGPSDTKGSLDVAADFCFTVAGAGDKVLFVGVNADQSFLRQIFGINQFPGVAELFSGECAVQDLIYRTVYANLFFLPALIPGANALSAEEQDIIRSATREMKSFSDWSIFHCPALSGFTNATMLAGIVDGVILVIKAEQTGRRVAQRTREKLAGSGAHILGAVLTDQKDHIPSWITSRL